MSIHHVSLQFPLVPPYSHPTNYMSFLISPESALCCPQVQAYVAIPWGMGYLFTNSHIPKVTPSQPSMVRRLSAKDEAAELSPLVGMLDALILCRQAQPLWVDVCNRLIMPRSQHSIACLTSQRSCSFFPSSAMFPEPWITFWWLFYKSHWQVGFQKRRSYSSLSLHLQCFKYKSGIGSLE